jgi:hypothetical protein
MMKFQLNNLLLQLLLVAVAVVVSFRHTSAYVQGIDYKVEQLQSRTI